MAIHVTWLTHHTPAASAPMARRPALPTAAIGSAGIRRPQTSPPPSYKAVAAAASADEGTAPSTDSSGMTGAQIIQALFPGGGTPGPAPAVSPAPSPAPTAEGVFGPNPWLANPTWVDPDGSTYGFNPQYFATPETAAKVAQMVGGTVVEANACITGPSGPFQQQQPNEMVRLANGTLINPGLVAGFYTHGYSQSLVDQMIANEIGGTPA